MTGAAENDNPQRMKSDNTMMHVKAQATRAGFKRPSFWVLAFGWSLALCAGFVNVVAMLSWKTYVSHVTGGTTSIGLKAQGYHSGAMPLEPLGRSIATLMSFLIGAFLCGLIIDKNQVHLGGKSLYGVALIGNSALLVTSVFVSSDVLAGCLAAAACGLQNAMCTSHFGAVVRTTHVTGTLTDIGSTLGRIVMIYSRKGCLRSRLNVLERAEVGVDSRKLLVLGPMWVFFLLGTIAGALWALHLKNQRMPCFSLQDLPWQPGPCTLFSGKSSRIISRHWRRSSSGMMLKTWRRASHEQKVT